MLPETESNAAPAGDRLDAAQVTLVYTVFHHLGDFVVMAGLLQKYDLLGVEFESLAAHPNSPHVPLFIGKTEGRLFNVSSISGFFNLIAKLRQQKKAGRIIFGIPMAPGSIQAYGFFWFLKKLGALTYIVDFNLNNADVLTPPRKRYIFDRHLAQAAELFKRPEWLADMSMPLALAHSPLPPKRPVQRVGLHPWSARAHLPEFKWPDEKWLELATLILENTGMEIVLLGRDNAFPELERVLRSHLPVDLRKRFISSPSTSVESLTNALQNLDFLVTVNTATLHLAHALKLPLVALCGSSAEMWLPEGDHIRLVHDTKAALPASDKYWHDPLQPSLQRIEVRNVYAAFLDLSQKFSLPS